MNEELKAILGEIISSQTIYKNVKLINNLLIVTLNNGNVLTRPNATNEDYNKIINSKCFATIKEIMSQGF